MSLLSHRTARSPSEAYPYQTDRLSGKRREVYSMTMTVDEAPPDGFPVCNGGGCNVSGLGGVLPQRRALGKRGSRRLSSKRIWGRCSKVEVQGQVVVVEEAKAENPEESWTWATV